MAKKWITYTVTGVVGLGLLAGGATAAANALELRDADGQVLPGGAVIGGNVIDRDRVELVKRSGGISVVTAPSPATVASAPSVPQAPAPQAPAPQAPAPDSVASAPSPVQPASPVTPPSPATPASVASAPSN